MLIEGKPGADGEDVGRSLIAGADGRPDLHIQANRDLGNGSPAVCDNAEGGVPGIDPPSFSSEDQVITDALLDFACRFQALSANDPCTLIDASGEHKKIHPQASTQFCLLSSGTATFPVGDTVVTVSLRDVSGELGPPTQIVVRVATATPTP